MALKEKILAATSKYGFTLRGFFIAALVFPPAGAYIAWKIPNYSVALRLSLAVLALAAPLVVVGPVLYLASWVWGQIH